MTHDEALALYTAGRKVVAKLLCDLSNTIESQQEQIKALEVKVAKLSKIFLAFDSMPHIRRSMSARMYTAVGCGAFYMCQHVEGIEDILEPGKEIVTFRSEQEMIDLIRYYLENDELRMKIAEAGQKRVLRDHTYEVRMRQMMEIIKDFI